jgi:hypothetical protein
MHDRAIVLFRHRRNSNNRIIKRAKAQHSTKVRCALTKTNTNLLLYPAFFALAHLAF